MHLRVCREDGYRVLVARDGKEAVEVVRLARPDGAILDIWMPRVNGLEAAAHIANLDAGIPIMLYQKGRGNWRVSQCARPVPVILCEAMSVRGGFGIDDILGFRSLDASDAC